MTVNNSPSAITVAGGAVQTSLNIPAAGASLAGLPGFVFGDGVARNYNLLPNGDAILTAAVTYPVSHASAYHGETAKIGFQILPGGMSLGTAGASVSSGNLIVRLPGGTGFAPNMGDTLLGNQLISNTVVALNGSLAPTAAIAFPQAGWFNEESKPLMTRFNGVTWTPATGSFSFNTIQSSFVRGEAIDALEAAIPDVNNPRACRRSSNDHYYRAVTGFKGGSLTVSANANGCGQLTGTLEFGLMELGKFKPHFPYGDPQSDASAIAFIGGVMKIVKDRVNPAESWLQKVLQVDVGYRRDCAPGTKSRCPGDGIEDSESVSFVPDVVDGERILRFTRDGGLHASGSIISAKALKWGRLQGVGPDAYVQEHQQAFTVASLHIAGHFISGGIAASDANAVTTHDISLSVPEAAAASILHAGVIPYFESVPDLIERPGVLTAVQQNINYPYGYARGNGNYAGVNFRVSEQAMNARSKIGNITTTPYALHPASKYYVRQSGVSGRHQAQGALGDLAIYNYDMTLSRYALGFLSNSNPPLESDTRAKLKVREPADVTFNLEKIGFACNGRIVSASLPEADLGATMLLGPLYWRGDFQPTAFMFASNDPCGGVTYIGVRTRVFSSLMPGVPLIGNLGFHPSGQLLRPFDGIRGLDSRFVIPATATLPGALNDKTYKFAATEHAFFNHQAAYKNGDGFLCFVGHMGVPFFGRVFTTIHGGAKLDPADNFYDVMRSHIYTHPELIIDRRDDHNLGFPNNNGNPGQVTPQIYRDGAAGLISGNDNHNPHVSAGWAGIAYLFKYDLEWSRYSRSFTSAQAGFNLFVVKLKTRLELLTASKVKMHFDSKLGIDLQPANIVDFGLSFINDRKSPMEIFAPGAGEVVLGHVLTAVTGPDRYLSANPRDAMEHLLGVVRDQVVSDGGDAPHLTFASVFDNSAFANEAAMDFAIGQQASALAEVITSRLGGILQDEFAILIESAIASIDPMEKLTKPGDFAAAVRNWILNDPNLYWLVGVAVLAEGYLESGLPESLKDLEKFVKDSDAFMKAKKSELLNAETGMKARIDAMMAANSHSIRTAIRESLTRQLAPMVARRGDMRLLDLSFATEREIESWVSRAMLEGMLVSPLARDIRVSAFERLDPVANVCREFFRGYAFTLNTFIADNMSSWAQALTNWFTSMAAVEEFTGGLSKIVGYGKLSGYAETNGDSLRELNVDGEFKFKINADLHITGSLKIKELKNLSSGGVCKHGPDRHASEIRITAKKVPAGWLIDGMMADISVLLTVSEDLSSGNMDFGGLGGSFVLEGNSKFEGFSMKRIGFGMFASQRYGAYVAAMCDIEFASWGLGGGLYMGASCTLDPILVIDPNMKSGYGPAPYEGIYIYGFGRIPIINNGCKFNLTSGFGAGFFAFHQAKGFRISAEVAGELACMVEAKGRADFVMAYVGGTKSSTAEGKLKLTATIRECPFCLKFSKEVKMLYDSNATPSFKFK
jgi:hypothetical protein